MLHQILYQPWHWSVSGLFIGLVVPLLLLLGNKKMGISSSLRHVCAACVPANISFFKYDWKKESWNLFFVVGVIGGAWIASALMSDAQPIVVATETKIVLANYGISDYSHIYPAELFNWENLWTIKGLLVFGLGGFLVGFGTRYAGGCTSGHTIMGLSNLQIPSLIATIAFMVGGFLSTHFILPLILK